MCNNPVPTDASLDLIVVHYKRLICEALDSMDIESVRELVKEMEDEILNGRK